ncbi:hypothetical protein ACP70R_005732 [Stipagrostis hirtigluma subsp. patula]
MWPPAMLRCAAAVAALAVLLLAAAAPATKGRWSRRSSQRGQQDEARSTTAPRQLQPARRLSATRRSIGIALLDAAFLCLRGLNGKECHELMAVSKRLGAARPSAA